MVSTGKGCPPPRWRHRPLLVPRAAGDNKGAGRDHLRIDRSHHNPRVVLKPGAQHPWSNMVLDCLPFGRRVRHLLAPAHARNGFKGGHHPGWRKSGLALPPVQWGCSIEWCVRLKPPSPPLPVSLSCLGPVDHHTCVRMWSATPTQISFILRLCVCPCGFSAPGFHSYV